IGRIYLPALRERPEDIMELFKHFLRHFNARHRTNVQEPTPELKDRLLSYEWPGNVRELRNFVEAIFIDPPQGAIGLQDLPESFRRIFASHRNNEASERDAIVSALSRTRWNKKLAARELQWSRMTLYRKLDKYKITGSD